MAKPYFIIIALFISVATYCQKFETKQGTIENLSGITQYKVIFEYPSELEIHKYRSEKDYVDYQFNKREAKKTGSGEKFKELWYKNRENRYEPTYIQNFNNFHLEDKHVAVSKNYKQAEHTMVIKVLFIHPGKDIILWQQRAELEVEIKIYRTNEPETILYSTEPLEINGTADGDEYEKITTAYGELGRWTAKFFCRKTLSLSTSK